MRARGFKSPLALVAGQLNYVPGTEIRRRSSSCGGRICFGGSGTALQPGSSSSCTFSAGGSNSHSTTTREVGAGMTSDSCSGQALLFSARSEGEVAGADGSAHHSSRRSSPGALTVSTVAPTTSKVSLPPASSQAPTTTFSPGVRDPERTMLASSLSTLRWMVRRSGLTPV